MTLYDLPKLPYNYESLEPYIDTQTMKIHHLKHHQSYVDGLNKTLSEIGGTSHPKYITSILSDLNSIPDSSRNKIQFFGGGYENHRFFWQVMTPDGGGSPGGALGDSIDVYFNSFEKFQENFYTSALGIQGSGWCWLVFNPTYNKIEIITTQNQNSPWSLKKIPLLGLDVWEHSYYLKYENKRNEYVLSWWNVVNWDFVCNRFSEISQ
ncbi:MAG: superoxide dismutase [Nitrosopumilaceae archaeon]|nr:superoxide dismutase [Nitrosopumilaceae archaeon]